VDSEISKDMKIFTVTLTLDQQSTVEFSYIYSFHRFLPGNPRVGVVSPGPMYFGAFGRRKKKALSKRYVI
jgi:hypothetical protein